MRTVLLSLSVHNKTLSMAQKIFLGIVGLVVVGALIAYFTGSDTPSTQNIPPAPTTSEYSETQPSTTGTTTNDKSAEMSQATETTKETATTTAKDVLAVTVRGANYKFLPNTLTAKQGQTVHVTFVSDSGVHNFVIDEIPGAQTKQLQSGQSEIVEFVADKKGSFKYYCSVGNHRAMGMEGTLIVE